MGLEERAARLRRKIMVTSAALLATGGSLVAQAKTDNNQRDDKNSDKTEIIESSLLSNDLAKFDAENVKKTALNMYKDCINNYVTSYLDEVNKDIKDINRARLRGINKRKAVSNAIGKRIDNFGQHCAEAGTFELFMQDYTPKFLKDIYANLQNPNYAPAIFDDLYKVAKENSDNPDKFFINGKGGIYKNIKKYNEVHNPQNACKLFLCQETNGGGKHFTVVAFDGKKYTRVSFNSENAFDLDSYDYGKTRIGKSVDITGIWQDKVDNMVTSTLDGKSITEAKTRELFTKLSSDFSSKKSPVEVLEYLVAAGNNDDNQFLVSGDKTDTIDFVNEKDTNNAELARYTVEGMSATGVADSTGNTIKLSNLTRNEKQKNGKRNLAQLSPAVAAFLRRRGKTASRS